MPIKWNVTSTNFEEQKFDQLPEGEYKFRVSEATIGTSQTGNMYLKLKLKVTSGNISNTCYDYIVDIQGAFYRKKHFWESVGFPDLIDVEDEQEYVGRSGRAKFKIEESYSPKHGRNLESLKVVDYIPLVEGEFPEVPDHKVSEKTESDNFLDDDLPF